MRVLVRALLTPLRRCAMLKNLFRACSLRTADSDKNRGGRRRGGSTQTHEKVGKLASVCGERTRFRFRKTTPQKKGTFMATRGISRSRSQAQRLSLTCGHVDGLYVVFEGLDDVRYVFNADLCARRRSKLTTKKNTTNGGRARGRNER